MYSLHGLSPSAKFQETDRKRNQILPIQRIPIFADVGESGKQDLSIQCLCSGTVQRRAEKLKSQLFSILPSFTSSMKMKHFGKVFNCPNIIFPLTSGPMQPAFGWSHHPLAIFDLTSLWSLRMWSMVDSSVMPRPVTSFLKGSRWYGHWSPRPWFRIII